METVRFPGYRVDKKNYQWCVCEYIYRNLLFLRMRWRFLCKYSIKYLTFQALGKGMKVEVRAHDLGTWEHWGKTKAIFASDINISYVPTCSNPLIISNKQNALLSRIKRSNHKTINKWPSASQFSIYYVWNSKQMVKIFKNIGQMILQQIVFSHIKCIKIS